MIARALAVLMLLAAPAFAETMDRSPRPQANPRMGQVSVSTSTAAASPAVAATEAWLRPKPRPAALEKTVAAVRETTEEKKKGRGLNLFGLRPKEKPEVQLVSAPAPAPKKDKKKSKEAESVRGSVCGVAAIKGEKIAPIKSKVQGCGLDNGVRVTSVSGVRLSAAATIDCATAKALNTWVEQVAQPAYRGQIVELRIAGHYVCRPRNNKKGAKVSEHGRGKAIDIAGFVLASGKVHQVLGGFDQTMRKAHKGACGIFGTTLGPGSDGYHEDHLHFDTASHRNGAYCR